MSTIVHKFEPGTVVSVDARCGYPANAGVKAQIDKIAPYERTGTPGYYVTWLYADAGIKQEQWHSAGGWKQENLLSVSGEVRR